MKKAYPTYKETEIPWLPKMPKGWEEIKFKYLFKERVEKGFSEEPLLAATQTQGVIPKEMYETRTVTAQKDFHLLKLVREGDFVISLRSFQGGIEYAHFQGIISPAYTVLNPLEGVYGGYFRHLLKSKNFIDDLTTYVTGIREGQNINYSDLRDALAPLPSLPEQRQIAAYLDYKCHLIDTFIAKKKRLIELLQEQKKAIINQAVTRGIDPDVPLKPSGVDWLGDIPEHWKRAKLKYYIDILPGFAFSSSEYSVNDNDIKLLRGVNINPDQIKWIENVYWPIEKTLGLERFFLQEGDIVFGMDRPWIKSGMRVAIISKDDLPSLLLQRVARLKTQDGLLQNYLFSILKSQAFLDYFSPQLTGVSVPHISTGQIGEFVLGIPPKDEQKEILEYSTTEQKRIELTIEKVTKEIDLIQEYKTTLIAEAVTGKIDVRDWQPNDTVSTVTLNELSHATKN